MRQRHGPNLERTPRWSSIEMQGLGGARLRRLVGDLEDHRHEPCVARVLSGRELAAPRGDAIAATKQIRSSSIRENDPTISGKEQNREIQQVQRFLGLPLVGLAGSHVPADVQGASQVRHETLQELDFLPVEVP
jgi:hypothetical protein